MSQLLTAISHLVSHQASYGFDRYLVEISFVPQIHVTCLLEVGISTTGWSVFLLFSSSRPYIGKQFWQENCSFLSITVSISSKPLFKLLLSFSSFIFCSFSHLSFSYSWNFFKDKIYWFLKLCNLFSVFNLNCIYFVLCLVWLCNFSDSFNFLFPNLLTNKWNVNTFRRL